jgi:hypothetical protein
MLLLQLLGFLLMCLIHLCSFLECCGSPQWAFSCAGCLN